MRKCRNCLCRTCTNVCCDRKNCIGKKRECKGYNGFKQLSIFDTPQKPQYNKAPRHSWNYYGISKERYKELTAAIRSGRYADMARSVAHTVNKDIAAYILLSVKNNLSYEGLERLWELMEIERMPCGRTDFYGYRRYFYYLVDKELRKNGL